MENNKYEYVRVVPIEAGMQIFPADGTTFSQLKEELEKSGFRIICDAKELSIYIASAPEGSTNTIETFSGEMVKCICFGKIQSEIEEAVNKFNSIPEEYRLSRGESEQLIFETTRK